MSKPLGLVEYGLVEYGQKNCLCANYEDLQLDLNHLKKGLCFFEGILYVFWVPLGSPGIIGR